MSVRRAARAARSSVDASARCPSVAGVAVPVELLDAGAEVWSDGERYRVFMAVRGWSRPAADRLGASAAPAVRRARAAVGWARENGLPDGYGVLAGWGLLEPG